MGKESRVENMSLEVDSNETVHTNTEQMRKLIEGKFKATKCKTCDGVGSYWQLLDTDEVVAVEPSDKSDYISAGCEDCHGLGYDVQFEGEDYDTNM